MTVRLLVTSFDVWGGRTFNSSDQLLGLAEQSAIASHFDSLRRLPVDTVQASSKIFAALQQQEYDYVVCCGMAEGREQLNLERQACVGDRRVKTTLPLDSWLEHLSCSCISEDAGTFVCNATYFEVLARSQHLYESPTSSTAPLKQPQFSTEALFLHIPVLTDNNRDRLLQDFETVITLLLQHGN